MGTDIMSSPVTRYRFNVDEYYLMGDAGIFDEHDRVELIEGDIIQLPKASSRHASSVMRLTALFYRNVAQRLIVSVHDPLRLDEYSEPLPDVALLTWRDDRYASRHPGPTDALLVVEVSSADHEYNRSVKLPVYARAGIVEVWLVDLPNEVIEVYSQPQSGKYKASRQSGRSASITVEALPGVMVKVDDILG